MIVALILLTLLIIALQKSIHEIPRNYKNALWFDGAVCRCDPTDIWNHSFADSAETQSRNGTTHPEMHFDGIEEMHGGPLIIDKETQNFLASREGRGMSNVGTNKLPTAKKIAPLAPVVYGEEFITSAADQPRETIRAVANSKPKTSLAGLMRGLVNKSY